MFGSFGALFVCGTNSDSNELFGYTAVVSISPVGVPARWCTPTLGSYCPRISSHAFSWELD
jgi:hypothetical protein